MRFNSYLPLQHLDKPAKISPGGVCEFFYAKKEDVFSWPQQNPQTGTFTEEVILKDGATWYRCQVIDPDRDYKEETKTGDAGPFVEMKLQGFLPDDSPINTLTVGSMPFYEYVIVLRERNGIQRLFGSEDAGAKFTQSYDSSDLDGTRGRMLVFTYKSQMGSGIYLSQVTASGEVINPPWPGGGGPELDPTVPQWVKAITQAQILNWNAAYSWGNHAAAGYLTQTLADSRYSQIGHTHPLSGLSDVAITSVTDTQLLRYNAGAGKWVNWTPTFAPGNHTHHFSDLLDIPTTIAGYGITDFNATFDTRLNSWKNVSNGIAGLDVNGKLASSVLPPLSTTETFSVASQAAMLALDAQRGDFAVRTDFDPAHVYILAGEDPAVLANWIPVSVGGIQIINGQSGANVTLTTSHIGEGTNLYFTAARGIQNQNASAQTANSWITGIHRADGGFNLSKNGSATLQQGISLYDADGDGANLQLNEGGIPGLAFWISNGSTFSKRLELFGPTSGVNARFYTALQVDGDLRAENQMRVGLIPALGTAAALFLTSNGGVISSRTAAQVRADIGAGTGGGSVTSVGLSLPSIFSVSGSPVETVGTLTATLVSQLANTVFAAPNGSAGAPTFRLLVAADIPTLTAAKISDFTATVQTVGDARYPLLSGSYVNPSWLASLPWTKITGAPTTFPTSSTLNEILANGNDAVGSDIDMLGDNRGIGWWNGSSRRWLLRQEAASGGNNIGWYSYSDAGVATNRLVIDRSTGVFSFTSVPAVGANPLWYSSNHPAGSAFTMTYTGAEVPATATYNAAGHTTAQTKRNLTAADISAIPSSAPSTIDWNAFAGTTTAAFNMSATNAPTATPYFGINMPHQNSGAYGAQIAFRNNNGYFRTQENSVWGSWLQFADKTWANATYAPISGSDNYIQNNITATPQSGSYRITGAATIQHDGSNALLPTLLLHNTSATRGVNFQLNADVNPGLATWIHNGTSWVKRQEYFADGKAQFYGQTLMPTFSGIAGTGTGTNNSSYFAFYESNGVTRAGYVGKGSTGNNTTYLWSDIGNVQIDAGTTAGAAVNIIANGNANIDVGGQVNLTNATKNHLSFNPVGVAAPTLTTRSAGTKVVLYPSSNLASLADYATGIETSYMWNSVPNSAAGFKWYGGTTEVARLSGTGQLSVNTSLTSPLITSPTGANLSVSSATGENITFDPSGTNRGVWDTDGRLGIGLTPSPARASLLEVNGNVWSTDAYILGTTSAPTAEFGLQGGGTNGSAFLRTMGTGNIDFQTSENLTRIRMSGTTGNILVNTTTDNGSDKLQVNGSINSSGTVAANALLSLTSISTKAIFTGTRLVSSAAAYSVNTTDHTILMDGMGTGAGNGVIITLPNPATSAGRELTFIENSTSQWGSSHSINRTNGPALTTIGGTMTIRAINGEWWLIQRIT